MLLSGGVPASVTITWEGGAEVGVVMGEAKATFPTYSDAIGACKGFPVKTSCQGQCAIGSHGNAGGLEGTDVGRNFLLYPLWRYKCAKKLHISRALRAINVLRLASRTSS